MSAAITTRAHGAGIVTEMEMGKGAMDNGDGVCDEGEMLLSTNSDIIPGLRRVHPWVAWVGICVAQQLRLRKGGLNNKNRLVEME
jgi:hypothetical protein